MSNQKHSPEIEILKKFYAALNGNDIPALRPFCASEMVRVEPKGFPSSGTYLGYDAFEAHFKSARETWAEGSCNPEDFIFNGDKIVVSVHVLVRLKDKMEWIDAHIADGFTLRHGKVLEMHTFAMKEEALKWAGVQDCVK